MDAYVLVDYDNLTLVHQNSTLVSLALRIQSIVESSIPNVGDIHVRLYGGWYGPLGLSQKGTRLAQEVRQSFPIPGVTNAAIRYTHCELASALVDSRGEVLAHTYRQRPGIRGRLASTIPSGCSNQSTCTAHHVVAWSKGRCPVTGCNVSTTDVFTYYEQKLVDTLLCCDLVALSMRIPSEPVFVISDDDDITPAFLLAGKKSTQIWQIQIRNSGNRYYDSLLKQNNVQVCSL